MPSATAKPIIRRGIQVHFNLDKDALQLLKVLTDSKKGFGVLISELLRKEAREREGRPALLARLQAQTEQNGM
jgi:hypothetical protein